MRKFFLVGEDPWIEAMFGFNDWERTVDIDKADLVQFTGGSDVTPEFYGEAVHPRTMSVLVRDQGEEIVFLQALALSKPMAGICRGGQFLNVMCGGSMYQHVDGHGIGGTHEMYDHKMGRIVHSTSTHHQMMKPEDGVEPFLTANQSTFRETMDEVGINVIYRQEAYEYEHDTDVEGIHYPEFKVLCYQPHPEYDLGDEEHYFATLKRTLEV